MEYERAEGAAAVEALFRRVADGIAKGELDVAGLNIACHPKLEASVSVGGDARGKLTSVVLRLTRFGHIDRPTALHTELSHPGG
jgi:hypothetical protein